MAMAMRVSGLVAPGRRCFAQSHAHVSILVRAISRGITSSSSLSTKAAAPNDATKTVTQHEPVSGTKISWLRGYLGVNSSTDPPDTKFLAVASVVAAAGFYAWFIDPPTPAASDEKQQENE